MTRIGNLKRSETLTFIKKKIFFGNVTDGEGSVWFAVLRSPEGRFPACAALRRLLSASGALVELRAWRRELRAEVSSLVDGARGSW